MRPMARAATPAKFKIDFCKRLQSARIVAGFTQQEVAQKLGLDRDTYAKYESRSLLPHYLIPQVCELFGIEPTFLYTGMGERVRKTGT